MLVYQRVISFKKIMCLACPPMSRMQSSSFPGFYVIFEKARFGSQSKPSIFFPLESWEGEKGQPKLCVKIWHHLIAVSGSLNRILIGGRWFIVTQLAVYTTYIPLVLANWMIKTCYQAHLFLGNQETHSIDQICCHDVCHVIPILRMGLEASILGRVLDP